MGTKAKTDPAGYRIRARPCKTYRFVTLRRWPLACLVDADLSPRVSLGGEASRAERALRSDISLNLAGIHNGTDVRRPYE